MTRSISPVTEFYNNLTDNQKQLLQRTGLDESDLVDIGLLKAIMRLAIRIERIESRIGL